MKVDARYGTGMMALGLLALTSGCVATEGSLGDGRGETGSIGEDLSIAQNTIWTVTRAGAAQTLRVVAYGDSIFAGYQGGFTQVGRRSAPYVAGEYLAKQWNANVQVVRRAETGGLASEVFGRITADKSYMEDPSTRAVYFEMCGNDYLSARRAFQGSSGRCDLSKLNAGLETCRLNTQKAMQQINTSAHTAVTKVVATLYYPGLDRDDVAAGCTDASGQHANVQKTLLPYIARSNWKVCDLARQNGFACADSFAEFMGADYDANADGVVDSDALRFDPSESEDAYVNRITVTLRDTIRDANHHGIGAGVATAGYMFSDDIHPTAILGNIDTNSNGSSPPDFADDQLAASGKNPKWNLVGHERLGWALAALAPSSL